MIKYTIYCRKGFMRMSGWTLFFCVFGLFLSFALLIADEKRRQHELLQMERMRNSMLYYDLYPMVLHARKHDIDQVRIERNRVVFYGVCPPGSMGEFVLSDRGYRPLNPQRIRALVLVLAEDIPLLRSNQHYRLRRYPMFRPNGQKDYGYQYVIRSYYKTALMYERRRVTLD